MSHAASPYRLPRTVWPRHYTLELEPDLDSATFAGSVVIDVDVLERVDEIVLNAAELDIDEAVVVIGDTEQPARVEMAPDLERIVISVDGGFDVGPCRLRFAFRGVLNDRLRGFYRSVYLDADGVEHTLATSQLESTDARRAFPCFDEPEFKATFGISLVVADDMTAISNAAEIGADPLGDGRRRVRFADTMKMSTYLVAFIVGELEATDPIDVDGVPVRVITPPGKLGLADFGLELADFCLRYFTRYYGIPYPGDKIDMIAIPDFAAGAMENLGAITFRETALLVDPTSATHAELERVADVVAHELAHMWFGDLVTMKWWNGIWLNEAFATFMELKAVDAFRPEWDRWTTEAVTRTDALNRDALESTRPIEIEVNAPSDAEAMFDTLTYTKGGGVLRMLEQYLGEDRFRDGIRRYLQAHAYDNTETHDLWDALEAATGEPVRKMMDAWIFRGGHPVVSASSADAPSRVVIEHHPFRLDTHDPGHDDRLVPVGVRVWAAGQASEHRVLLSGDRALLEVGESIDAVLLNSGGHGFMRTRYESALNSALAERLAELSPIERYGVVSDTWAAVLAGLTPARDFLGLVTQLVAEDDPSVITAVHDGLSVLRRILASEPRARLEARVRDLAGAMLSNLGDTPGTDEPERRRAARGKVLRLAGLVGDDAALAARAAGWIDAPDVDPEVRAAAIAIVAAHSGEDRWLDYVDRYKNASNPQTEIRFLLALTEFRDPELAERTLSGTLDGTVRSQNAAFVVNGLLRNDDTTDVAWRFLRENWSTLNDRLPTNSIVRLVTAIDTRCTPEQAADAEAFFAEHPIPQAGKTLDQQLARMRVHVALRAREADRLAAELG